MNACSIFLFSKRKLLNKLKEIFVCKVEAGLNGFAKNKGAVALRFKVQETTFSFINTHLESGEGQAPKRAEVLQ